MQQYVIALIAIGGFAVYLVIVMVCLYEKGCLVKIHPMNNTKRDKLKLLAWGTVLLTAVIISRKEIILPCCPKCSATGTV